MKEILSEGLTSSLDSFGTFPKSINSPHSPRLEKVHRKAVFYEGFPYIIIYIAIPGIMSRTLCLKCCLSIDLVEGKIVLKHIENIIYHCIYYNIFLAYTRVINKGSYDPTSHRSVDPIVIIH